MNTANKNDKYVPAKYVPIMKELVSAKEISKISTDQIIKASGYSKPTFYKFFSDKYDLAFFVYKYDMTEFLNHYANTLDYKKMMSSMCYVLRRDIKYYKNLLKDSYSRLSFYTKFYDFSMDYNISLLGRANLSKQDIDVFCVTCYGSIEFILKWLEGGAKESDEYIVSVLEATVPSRFILKTGATPDFI